MTTQPRPHTRWYVRPITSNLLRFGDDPHRAIAWAVYSYRARDANRDPLLNTAPTIFAARTAALAYAHRQARREYGEHRR